MGVSSGKLPTPQFPCLAVDHLRQGPQPYSVPAFAIGPRESNELRLMSRHALANMTGEHLTVSLPLSSHQSTASKPRCIIWITALPQSTS